MLEFDNLQTTLSNEPEASNDGQVLVIYKTDNCLSTVREALAFEGFPAPNVLEGKLPDRIDQLTGCRAQLLIIESSDDDQDQILLLRRVLPRYCSIILLGTDNQVSTARQWRRMGIDYQLWPAAKEDIVDQIRLSLDQTSTRTAHSAVRVGVTGAKGGAGVSFLSAQLAKALAKETGQSGLLVDHGYQSSNMHVMLGMSALERESRETRWSFPPEQNLDFVEASSLQIRVSEKLNYLGSSSLASTHQALNLLSRDNSFIIEDCASETPATNGEWLTQLDALIIVIPATFSGLCQGRVLLEQLQEKLQKKSYENLRCYLVLNHCQPRQKVTNHLAEQYFKRTLHTELPWADRCEDWLITGESAESGCPALARPLRNIARAILGKPPLDDTLLDRLLRRFR